MSLEHKFEWEKPEHRLRDVDRLGLPQAVKVTHGQFQKIGVTKSKHPENIYQELLLHSIRNNKKVIAHALKTSQVGKLDASVDLKLSIPLTYTGWFEVMSEDGRSARPLLSVHELARHEHETCLVRETAKAYLAGEDNQIYLNHEKTIVAGERLKIMENKTIKLPGRQKKFRLLHCLNSKKEHVYLPHDAKCCFSIITTSDSTSGVHTIENVTKHFRFPVSVRIVHGSSPRALKNSKYSGILRLMSSESDNTAFFMPLLPCEQKEKMIPLSSEVPLKLCYAKDRQDYLSRSDVKELLSRCSEMVLSYMTSIHVLVNTPFPGHYKSLREPLPPDVPERVDNAKKRVVDVLFQEVDDLYGYVRDGGTPPESRLGQITGIHSNDWEEPIYEFIDKYQVQTPEPAAPTDPTASVAQNKTDILVSNVHQQNNLASPKAFPSGEKTDIHNSPTTFLRTPGATQTSPRRFSADVSVSPTATLLKEANGRGVRNKIYDSNKLLVTYARAKSFDSGSKSSGEKCSKDSKDNKSKDSKGSPTGDDHRVVTKRKSLKSMYL